MKLSHNQISSIIINVCIKIHKQLGPGLLESVYEEVLFHELTKNNNLSVSRQELIPIVYNGIKIEKGFRADLIVENKVLLELKSVESLHDVYYKTTLTYLKLTGLQLGLLINFNETLLKNGLRRIVNNFVDE